MTTTKWFFQGNAEAYQVLSAKYEHMQSVFQIVTKDRVVEMWQCHNDGQNTDDMILVTIAKHGKDSSLLIYKADYMRGWQVRPESKVLS